MITIDFNKLDIRHGNKILDIGCGEGRHTIKAAQQHHSIAVGADFGFQSLIETQKKLEFHKALDDLTCKSIDLSQMDVTTLPFKNNTFDVVICSEVLEHIPDHDKAMSELVRIVRPGKYLAISVPRFLPEKICWMFSDDYFNANMGHIRIYNKAPLVQKIESLGATLFASHYAHSIHTPYWWLKCLVGPNKTNSTMVNVYHKFLVWDLMKKPWLTSFIDRLFNPILGKSLVLYFKKQ